MAHRGDVGLVSIEAALVSLAAGGTDPVGLNPAAALAADLEWRQRLSLDG
jgi:hypothetical protein